MGPERKWVVCSIPQPKTKKEVQEFLGVAVFCHILITGYSSLAKHFMRPQQAQEKTL
jgi:hypothetical protein